MKNPMTTFFYCRPEYCEKSRYKFTSIWDADDLESLAEDAAEDWQDNHDGWESHWPLVFNIYDADDNLLGSCSVEREYNPTFHANKVETPASDA